MVLLKVSLYLFDGLDALWKGGSVHFNSRFPKLDVPWQVGCMLGIKGQEKPLLLGAGGHFSCV